MFTVAENVFSIRSLASWSKCSYSVPAFEEKDSFWLSSIANILESSILMLPRKFDLKRKYPDLSERRSMSMQE